MFLVTVSVLTFSIATLTGCKGLGALLLFQDKF